LDNVLSLFNRSPLSESPFLMVTTRVSPERVIGDLLVVRICVFGPGIKSIFLTSNIEEFADGW
jgi:hypothetical protein